MNNSDRKLELVGAGWTRLAESPLPELLRFGPEGPSREALAAVRAHPRFQQAASVATASMARLYRGNRLLNLMTSDHGRIMISLLAVYLHLNGGLTVSRMAALCSEQGLSSPGRAKAMLMLMRAFGFLAPAPAEADRRLRRLMPTARLMALHAERNRRLFEAIAMVLPECAEAFAAQTHPDFTGLFVCRYCDHFLTGFRLIDGIPHMRLFLDRNGGTMVLCSLMLSGEPDDVYPPALPVRVSPSALSRRLGISRAHVRRLLQDAETQGLLERVDDDRIRLLPTLRQGASDIMARQFLLAASCAQGAAADLGRQSAVA
jgi:hypothetical protein